MQIMSLKSGLFAHPDPSKRHVNLEKGKIVEVGAAMAKSLIESGWGEVPADKPLSKMNKGELIKYAEDNDIDIDITATNADMVLAITWAEANPDG